DGYAFADRADVLEVGCGDAMIWRENADRITAGWRLTLTDLSSGMVEAARAALGDRARYAVADVVELPFTERSFHAVMANHMLFHVEERARAFAEIRRVLRSGGRFVGTAIGRNHLRELRRRATGSGRRHGSDSRSRTRPTNSRCSSRTWRSSA